MLARSAIGAPFHTDGSVRSGPTDVSSVDMALGVSGPAFSLPRHSSMVGVQRCPPRPRSQQVATASDNAATERLPSKSPVNPVGVDIDVHDSYPPVTKLGSEGCRLKGVIRTLAELLLQVKERESERLDAVDIKHAPTIGTMYEGLSKELLAQVIPGELNLQVVSGFLIDGQGGMSGQIDCMLVEGEGERIPYTYDFNWHIKDLVAVFEIKKTLYAKDLADAFAHLRKAKDLEHNYNKTLLGDVTPVNIDSALRAFAETTRLIFPGWEHLDSLDLHHQYIFHTLLVSCASNPLDKW